MKGIKETGERRQCYICWEQTNEQGPCQCNAVVHHACRFKWLHLTKRPRVCTLCNVKYRDTTTQLLWNVLYLLHGIMHAGMGVVLVLLLLSTEMKVVQRNCIYYITVYIVLNRFLN